MANIVITLLTSKRTRQTIDNLDVQVAASGSYVVVAGENASTEIQVNYPDAYANKNCYVHMRNAKGEYATQTFTGITTSKTFRLPDTMTFAGNTILTFYALDGNVKTVWCPVIIPVTSTGVNYHEVARCSEDVLMEALTKVANIESAEAAREAAEFQRNNSESIRIANEATRQSNESERIANWGALQPQMEQIIADTAAAEAAAETINDIYSQMSMTLCYDDEGYPCYAEEE